MHDPRNRTERLGPIKDYDPTKLPPPRVGRPPGTPGKVTREMDYRCQDCQVAYAREELLVKRATWLRLGRNGRGVKSRAVKWVCDSCAAIDPDWNRKPHSDAPAMNKGSVRAES